MPIPKKYQEVLTYNRSRPASEIKIDNRDLGSFDWHILSYKLSEKLVVIALLIYVIYAMFSAQYIHLPFFTLRLTPATLALLLGQIAGSLYLPGLYVNMDKKTYFKILFLPTVLLPIEILLISLLKLNEVPISIVWSHYLLTATLTLINIILMIYNYNKVKIEYVEMSDPEALSIIQNTK